MDCAVSSSMTRCDCLGIACLAGIPLISVRRAPPYHLTSIWCFPARTMAGTATSAVGTFEWRSHGWKESRQCVRTALTDRHRLAEITILKLEKTTLTAENRRCGRSAIGIAIRALASERNGSESGPSVPEVTFEHISSRGRSNFSYLQVSRCSRGKGS
jgi:hypothetical protein